MLSVIARIASCYSASLMVSRRKPRIRFLLILPCLSTLNASSTNSLISEHEPSAQRRIQRSISVLATCNFSLNCIAC
jgi:uncharacterized protein (DUF2249 family)